MRILSHIACAGAALLLIGSGLRAHAQEAPYPGNHNAVPGNILVQDYDTGGQGVGYFDVANVNQGGQYRTSEGVSLEGCSEGTTATGLYDYGYCAPGDYLNFTVTVAKTDNYNIGFRVAAPALGGLFHLEVDGTNVTGSLQIPNTGGYQNWQTVTAPNVNIASGTHIFHLALDASTNGTFGNFHYINFTAVPTGPPAAPTALTGVAGNASAYLTFTGSTGAASYKIKRSLTGAAGSFTTIGTTTTTSYVDTGLTNGTVYYYVVDATNNIGDSADSNKVSVTPTIATTRILYYTFEDGPGTMAAPNVNITDVTGNGYNGMFLQGANPNNGFSTDAKVGNYAGFTDATVGTTRYIAVSSALPDLTGQFSIFTYVKMVPANNIQTIFANSGAGNNINGFKLYVNHYATQDGAVVFENSDGVNGNMNLSSPPGAYPADGNYHAVALVADKTNGMATIYVDGVVVASGATLTGYETNTPFTIGQFTGGTFLSTSKFDEFQIYRGLITASTVATLSGISTVPAAPTNLTGVAGNSQATLSYTGVSGASYNLYRSLSATGPFTQVKSGIVGTTYTDTGLTNGTTYYYYVTAANAAGESVTHSNIVSVTPLNTTTLVLDYTFSDGPGTAAAPNSTITDVTGHGYNGAFIGNGDLTQGFSTDAYPGFAYAGSTDPTQNRYIQVSAAKSFDFTSQFTMFTRIKMADNFQIQSIFGNAPGYPENGFKLFLNSYNSQDHKLFFEYEAVQVVSAPVNIADGNYHALALSADQINNVVKIYLDGVVVANAALTTPFPTNSGTTGNPIYLGTDGYFSSTSKFDDFRIYQGILTDAQITALSAPAITVTGSVALEGVSNLGAVSPNAPLGTFHIIVRTAGTSTVVKTADVTLTTTAGSPTGTFTLAGIPAGTYDVLIKGRKNLAVLSPNVVVSATGGTIAPVTLPAGDTNNDNFVDSSDFGTLIGAFNTDSSIANSGYDPTADLNFDGVIDSSDFGLLIGEFNNAGAN